MGPVEVSELRSDLEMNIVIPLYLFRDCTDQQMLVFSRSISKTFRGHRRGSQNNSKRWTRNAWRKYSRKIIKSFFLLALFVCFSHYLVQMQPHSVESLASYGFRLLYLLLLNCIQKESRHGESSYCFLTICLDLWRLILVELMSFKPTRWYHSKSVRLRPTGQFILGALAWWSVGMHLALCAFIRFWKEVYSWTGKLGITSF